MESSSLCYDIVKNVDGILKRACITYVDKTRIDAINCLNIVDNRVITAEIIENCGASNSFYSF